MREQNPSRADEIVNLERDRQTRGRGLTNESRIPKLLRHVGVCTLVVLRGNPQSRSLSL